MDTVVVMVLATFLVMFGVGGAAIWAVIRNKPTK